MKEFPKHLNLHHLCSEFSDLDGNEVMEIGSYPSVDFLIFLKDCYNFCREHGIDPSSPDPLKEHDAKVWEAACQAQADVCGKAADAWQKEADPCEYLAFAVANCALAPKEQVCSW